MDKTYNDHPDMIGLNPQKLLEMATMHNENKTRTASERIVVKLGDELYPWPEGKALWSLELFLFK